MTVQTANQIALSNAIHRGAAEARIGGEHRFAEVMELRFQGFTVTEMVALLAAEGVHFVGRPKRAEVVEAMREMVGIA